MELQRDRLIQLRENMGICKSEAAKRMNTTAMSYGRYESGERVPSYQTVSYIAQTFGTSVDYLYGLTDSPEPTTVQVDKANEPELFAIVEAYRADEATARRLFAYAEKFFEKSK